MPRVTRNPVRASLCSLIWPEPKTEVFKGRVRTGPTFLIIGEQAQQIEQQVQQAENAAHGTGAKGAVRRAAAAANTRPGTINRNTVAN